MIAVKLNTSHELYDCHKQEQLNYDWQWIYFD